MDRFYWCIICEQDLAEVHMGRELGVCFMRVTRSIMRTIPRPSMSHAILFHSLFLQRVHAVFLLDILLR